MPSNILPVFPEEQWQTATPESQGVNSQKLTAALEEMKAVCGPSGISEVVVVRNGYVISQAESARNKHAIWSCTKSFMSTCLGLLWDDGKCSPETLAADWYPELKKDYPTVTLQHLATFTSGYDCADNDFSKMLSPAGKPGEIFQYSPQSDLLAAILTRIAGESLESLFCRRIGNEIGLTPDQFHWNSTRLIDEITLNGGAGFPPTGVYCSALGLARFGWFYANGGNWKGKQLISRRYIEYACVPQVAPTVAPRDPADFYKDIPGVYGLNWWVNGIRHDGCRLLDNAPVSTFMAQGNKNNICFIIPDWKMSIARCGDDEVIYPKLYDAMFRVLKEALADCK